MRVDYSMFEGIEVTGMPDAVLSRGRVIVEGDKFVGRPGAGEFLKRSLYSHIIVNVDPRFLSRAFSLKVRERQEGFLHWRGGIARR